MDSLPIIPQRPKRIKDTAGSSIDTSESISPETNAFESNSIASEAQPMLSTPPIPSRPKRKTANTEQAGEKTTETSEKANKVAFTSEANSFPTSEETEISSPLTPTDIISEYESEPKENMSGNSVEESGSTSSSNVDREMKEDFSESSILTMQSENVAQSSGSDDITPGPSSKDSKDLNAEEFKKASNTSEENHSVPSPIELAKHTTDTAPLSRHAETVGEEANEPENKTPIIPVRPRSSKSVHSETDLPNKDTNSLPLQQSQSDPKRSENKESFTFEPPNSETSSEQFEDPLVQNSPTEDLNIQGEKQLEKNAIEVVDEQSDISEHKEVSDPAKHSPITPARPQPTIPTRPSRKKEVATDTVQTLEDSSIGSNVKTSEVSSEAATNNSATAETNTSPSIKKAPPPKPKKLSSKIAAFQQMFNQEPPQKPNLTKNPSEERTKLSSDRSNFAASLSSMMGRGVALPGMANPELMKKLSAAESEEDETKSNEQDVTTTSVPAAPTRRARGPRGKKLPKSIKESQVEVKSRFTIHSADLWEVDIKRSEPLNGREDSQSTEISGANDDFSDAIEEQSATKLETVQEPNLTVGSADAKIKEDSLPVRADSTSEVESVPLKTDEENESETVESQSAPRSSLNKVEPKKSFGDKSHDNEFPQTSVIPSLSSNSHELADSRETNKQDSSNSSLGIEETEVLKTKFSNYHQDNDSQEFSE